MATEQTEIPITTTKTVYTITCDRCGRELEQLEASPPDEDREPWLVVTWLPGTQETTTLRYVDLCGKCETVCARLSADMGPIRSQKPTPDTSEGNDGNGAS